MDSEEGLDDLPSPDSTKGGKKKVKQDKPKKGNWMMTRATKLPSLLKIEINKEYDTNYWSETSVGNVLLQKCLSLYS